MAAKDGKLILGSQNAYQKLTGGKPVMQKAGNSMKEQPKQMGSMPKSFGKAQLGSAMIPAKK